MESNGETVRLRQSSCHWREQFLLQEAGGLARCRTCATSSQPGGVPPSLATRQAPQALPVEGHPLICKFHSYFRSFVNLMTNLIGMFLQAYAPLGSHGSPGNDGPDVLSHPTLISIANKLQKTPAQVALRWGIQMGQSVLPKSDNEAWTRENIDLFDWCVPDD